MGAGIQKLRGPMAFSRSGPWPPGLCCVRLAHTWPRLRRWPHRRLRHARGSSRSMRNWALVRASPGVRREVQKKCTKSGPEEAGRNNGEKERGPTRGQPEVREPTASKSGPAGKDRTGGSLRRELGITSCVGCSRPDRGATMLEWGCGRLHG